MLRTKVHRAPHHHKRHLSRAHAKTKKSSPTLTQQRLKHAPVDSDDLPDEKLTPSRLWKHERNLDHASEFTVDEHMMDKVMEDEALSKQRSAISPQSYYQFSSTKRSISRWFPDVNAKKDTSYWDYQSYRPKYRNLDDYSTVERLGQGKFSEVFEGYNDRTGDHVTIKLLKPVKKDKIRRETLILNHMKTVPYTTNLKDLIRCPESRTVGLVYEYNDNVPLSKMYDILTLNDAKRYTFQLLTAVNEAHQRGIMHRDIKPGNILFDPKKKRAILADWGLAEFYHPYAEYHVKVGTKGYKGPELLTNMCEYDYSVDTWALGTTLANMLFKGRVIPNSKDDDEGLVNVAKFGGSDALYQYLEKYQITTMSKTRFKMIGNYRPARLIDFVSKENRSMIEDEGLDLVSKMLTVDHYDRIPAHLALRHPFFDEIRHDPQLNSINAF